MGGNASAGSHSTLAHLRSRSVRGLPPSRPPPRGAPGLSALLRRRALIAAFDLDNDVESVLKLLQKYANVPMSLADACLVRMSETLPEPIILTTDSDFRIYRRHSRQMVPCLMPS